MPLNSTPCTVNAASVRSQARGARSSPPSPTSLCGAAWFPATSPRWRSWPTAESSDSKHSCAIPDCRSFRAPTISRCSKALREAARLGLPVAVHAESQEITQGLGTTDRENGSVREFLASRPVVAELEAIQRATLLARRGRRETAYRSRQLRTRRGACRRGPRARRRRFHRDLPALSVLHRRRRGAAGRDREMRAPAARRRGTAGALWRQLLAGTVDIVASDHSPAPPEMKTGDFGQAWGGIAGVQSTLAVLLDRGYHCRQLSLERISSLVAAEPARQISNSRQRRDRDRHGCGPGAWWISLDRSIAARTSSMQRHALSPYIGATFRGSVVRTMRRGETILHPVKSSHAAG